MVDQYVNEIPLGNGVSMKEFFLVPGDSAPIPMEIDAPTEENREGDRLVKIYHAEEFVKVNGRKTPAIFEGSYKLSDITMDTLEGTFEPDARFKKAINARREKALEALVKSGGHDGKNVSVRDWHISEEKVKLIGQAIYYSQFRATDNAQDEPLKPYDESFPEGAALRDYVVVNGKESRKGTDILSNLLGAAFIVKSKGQDEQDYFLLGRIRRNKVLSVIGGTPMWEEDYFGPERTGDFAQYMKKLGQEEHHEELSLNPDEIEIGNKVLLVRTLLRVFDPFYTVDVDSAVTIENIAARCYGNEEALKEHDRFYALPRTAEAVQKLMNNTRGYNVGLGTIAGLSLAL
ncbi:TPA: hypothetical protein HA234_06430 [Candidatus Woesearchaeota archaeon]|nr:hypothetical protein [Candidatus Woesearchaeota archaeon]HIG93805.1 hypothetical protein [Candidatus Woesearchaeota archaeon]